MNGLGRPLIIIGLLLIVAGIVISSGSKFTYWFGRLPGDISFKQGNFGFYFPLTTCLLLSIILTFIMWFLKK